MEGWPFSSNPGKSVSHGMVDRRKLDLKSFLIMQIRNNDGRLRMSVFFTMIHVLFFPFFFAISYRLKKLMLVFERIAELYILVWNRLDKFNFEDCLLLSVNSKSLKLGSNSFLNRCFHITFYFYNLFNFLLKERIFKYLSILYKYRNEY